MSFFSKLFGGTFESHRDEADAHYAASRWGEARLSYAKALDKAKDVSIQETSRLRQHLSDCKQHLAFSRLQDIEGYLGAGELEEAQAVLEDTLEISDAPEVRAAVDSRRKEIAALHQQRLLGAAEEMSEEDVLAVIAGTWTEAEANEMAQAPDEARQALLLAHDGQTAQAAELLAAAIAKGPEDTPPCYLYYELAKLQLATRVPSAAAVSLAAFLERCDDDEPEDRKLRASSHLLMSRILTKLERPDEVAEHWRAAARLLPGSHEVMLNVGIMQRERGELNASLASLEKARELMGQMRPDVSVIREMGITYLAKGARREAKETFMSVVEHFASKGEHDSIDTPSALALAKLHEEDGDYALAADLLRHLASGHDLDNHFAYNLEAARLLRLAKAEPSLVTRYFESAEQLAENDKDRAMLSSVRAQ